MPAPILNCPTCGSPVSSFDQYCGVCGAVLARLRWSTPEEKAWHSTDGYVAVRQGARSALVRFRNEGVVPAGLVLRAEHVAELPDWVDRKELEKKIGEQTLVLPPNADEASFTELEIPLVAAQLAPLFEEEESAIPRVLEREAHLPFLTNLNELQDGRWTSRPFKLTLLAARRPWISPARSHYRFLPIERLDGNGLEHRIELHNETIQDIDLLDIRITDDPDTATPPGYERLPAAAIFHREELEQRQPIEAGGSWSDVLRLALADPSYKEKEALQWFAAVVEYQGESVDGRESHAIACRIQGRVGRGPTLRVVGEPSLVVRSDQLQKEHSFEIENPGQLPVRIETVEILREREGAEEAVAGRDWLALGGIAEGDLLAPGERRSLQVRLKPAQRPLDDFEEESQRRVRIRHDGLPGQGQALVTLEVTVRFGRAEVRVAGIDFGTTNSVVCIRGKEASYPLRLETDPAPEPDLAPNPNRIRSLMYFDSNARGGFDESFLFGDLASSSANVSPENLVRSIKTVIARKPWMRYVFYRSGTDSARQRVTRTAQELLNLFISELRRRGEMGARLLPRKAFSDLGLDGMGTQINLGQAVFSHPAEIGTEAKRALMEAARRAGINEAFSELDGFFGVGSIDEATAAVLAYAEERVLGSFSDLPRSDTERVLCFDMGGGTTDMAAIEVLGIASYDAGERERVTVNLKARAGVRFGGDYLDQLLALMILQEIGQQIGEQSSSVVLPKVELAICSTSYPDFRDAILQLREAENGRDHAGEENGDGAQAENEWLAIYKVATEILKSAEKAKRKLSSLEAEEVTTVLSGSIWPHVDGVAATENFEVRLQRAAFEDQVREETRKHLHLLDSIVQGADWKWPEVTTLLFTGQSARMLAIREEVANYIESRRGTDAPELLRIEPGRSGFDPKNCVAIGAAIWGANQQALEPWLEIHNHVQDRLTYDLETKSGPAKRPRFTKVPGLERGQSLPAQGRISLPAGMKRHGLELYRDRGESAYVTFKFPLEVVGPSDLVIQIHGPNDFSIVVGGREYKGEVRS